MSGPTSPWDPKIDGRTVQFQINKKNPILSDDEKRGFVFRSMAASAIGGTDRAAFRQAYTSRSFSQAISQVTAILLVNFRCVLNLGLQTVFHFVSFDVEETSGQIL